MILKPFAFVFLAVKESIDTVALTFAFDVFTFEDIAVLPYRTTFSVGLARLHLTLVFTSVLHLVGTQRNFLSLKGNGTRCQQGY